MSQTPQAAQSQTKITINLEEARTELQATLAAGRELGPEMDETLAARYVERLDTLFPDAGRDSSRLRSDVEALMVSARTHGADADAARAKDFVARALAPRAAPPIPVAPAGPLGQRGQMVAPFIPMIVIGAVLIALAATGHWEFWWLVAVPGFLFWRGRGRGRGNRYRRFGYWDGYGPNMPSAPDQRGQLPPGNPPEML